MPAGVGLEVVLDLGDVTLEARAQREHPGHLLVEELRRVGLGAVDPGGAADDDRADRLRLLAGSEQLERADHVDVVHRPRRHARTGAADDLVVHDRVDPGLRDQLRDHRAADVGVDQLGALEGRRRLAGVEPGDVLELRVALEAAGQVPAHVAADTRDQDAPGH
jgi:hypothetical protein